MKRSFLNKSQLILCLVLIAYLLFSFNTMLHAQSGSMQRLTIYEKNKSYFYDKEQDRPVFLSGQVVWTSICTPKLWYSHSTQAFNEKHNNKEDVVLDPDKVIEYLAQKGGNCCRLTTLYGHYPEGKSAGPIYFPWAKTAGSGQSDKYDLLSFDETYWERFRHFLGLLEKNRIYVFLEVFPNLWSLQFSPLHPDKNINYTKTDLATNKDWYNSVRGGSEKILAVQEAFVKKLVDESLPFHNVIYLINNQYLSEVADIINPSANVKDELVFCKECALAWPRYWSRFIKDIGNQHDEALLVSTMPHFHPAYGVMKENFQWYVDEELFDFVDAGWWRQHPFSPEYSLRETVWMDEFDEMPLRERASLFAKSLRSWYDYMLEKKQVKPLVLSKSLFWDGVLRHSPWPLWLGFVSGYAASSPHEPMSRSYWNAPRYEPTADIVGHLHRFIRETKIEFWNMKPTDGVAYGNGQDAYMLANEGEEYVIYLVGEAEGPLLARLPEGEYIVEHYDPKTGQWIDTKLCSGSSQTKLDVHKYYDEQVLFIQKRSKREEIKGMKFPSVINK